MQSVTISHMAALRYALWFEENAKNSTIKVGFPHNSQFLSVLTK